LSKFGDVYIDSSHVQRDPIDISLERLRHPSLELMLHAMSLCSNASVVQINEDGDLEPTGSPTEVALQVLCCKARIWRSDLEANGWTRRGEWAFDSGVKMMSVGYLAPDGAGVIFLKGAPERLLARCTHFLEETQEGTQSSVGGVTANAVELVPMNANMRNHVLASVGRLASKGLRVLALGYRSCEDIRQCDIQDLDREYVESNVVYVGLVGVFDPPRAESAPAVELCKRAGIRVRMLTGDIQETAKSIAQTLGILTPQHSLSLNGPEFDQLSNAELDKMSDLPRCISRCSPDTKVSVVKALQRRKLVVLMTGDGVNDAPALKMANVGVAMGSGSDVTKGAADIVVTNDSFASIVKAIAEGRRIFNSLKQFTFHLLSANVAQVLSLVIGLVFMDDNERSVFILSPLAILFVNTMSGLATMGLAFDKADPDVMHRPPNTEGLFTKELLSDIFVTGFIMGALTLSNFVIVMYGVGDGNLHTGCNYYSATCSTVAEARATAFATMHILLLFQAYVVRSGRRSVFAQHFFDNRFLWLAVTCGILAIFPIIYIPVVAQDVFHQKAISWEWGLILGALVLYLLATEIYTLIKNLYFPEERPVVDQNVQDGRRELAISDAEDEDQFEMIRQEMLPPSVSVQLNLHAIARGQRQLASTPAPEHASRITRAHSSHLVTVSFPAAGDVPSTQTLTEVQGLPLDDPHASPENAV
jgi:potassium/sodium efflux P-type ATPase